MNPGNPGLQEGPLAAGAIVGGYQLIRHLGHGGMGEVWLAQDQMTERQAALKFIKPQLLADPAFRDRFLAEARTLARLEHERIVTLYSAVEHSGRLALAMRFVQGESLSAELDREGKLALTKALGYSRDILGALGHAHSQGVVHRDVKPDNILLDASHRAFLTDFGIAVNEFAERKTQTGFAIGTPDYMSPEQIRRPRAINQRSDIYSFAVVLYEMLAGRRPFLSGENPDDYYHVYRAHCEEPAPPLRDFRPEIPEALEAVVLRALEKDPNDRPADCREFIAELEAAAGSAPAPARKRTVVEGVAIPVTAPVTPPAPPVSKPKRGGIPKFAWLGLAAVVVAGGITYAILSAPKQEPPPTSTTSTKQAETAEVTPKREPVRPPVERKQTPVQPPPVVPGPVVTAATLSPKAEGLYREASQDFEDSQYCPGKAKMDEALELHPGTAKYLALQKKLADGCNFRR